MSPREGPSKQSRRQYLWIIRNGLTNDRVDPYDADSDITYPEGVDHARAVGERIRNNGKDTIPTAIFCSPLVRTVHTAQIIALNLRPQCRCVRVEEGLIEWGPSSSLETRKGKQQQQQQQQARATTIKPKSLHQLAARYGTIDLSYKSVNPIRKKILPEDNNNYIVSGDEGEETEEQLIERCGTTLTRLLRDVNHGENLAVVSHGPCDQAISIHLEGKAEAVEQSNLGPWPLGGVTLFSRLVDGTKNGEWELEFYGNTDHMSGLYKRGIKRWSLPCLKSNRVDFNKKSGLTTRHAVN